MPPQQRAGHGRRVELHVRTPAEYGTYSRQTAVVERLEQLQEAGAVDDFSVETWSKSIDLCVEDGTIGVDESCEALEEFWEWAERSGGSLEPAFRRRQVTENGPETSRERVTLPVMCLAVYADDELVAVVPCSDGEETYTVPEALDDLEAGRSLAERLP